jgi:uncharacterized protein involved in exopolysaccharide biosynthesis
METSEQSYPERTQNNRDLELFRKRTQASREPELSRNILNILFKWKGLILTCFVVVVVPVLIVTLLKPSQYQVTTKFLLKTLRAEVALTPAGPERILNSPITPQVINSEIAILKSLDLINKAVETSSYPLLTNGENGSAAQKERALQSLRARINITPIPESNVIEVGFQDQDPRQAAQFLNTLAALYLEKHATVHRGGDNAVEFFEEQAAVYKTRFEKTSEALKQFQEKNKIIDLGQETSQNLEQFSKLEEMLKQLQADIEAGEKGIGTLEQQVKQQPDQISTQKTVMVNPEITSISSKVIELERQRNELLQRYTPKSRFVMDKENEITALRKQLEETQPHVAGDTIISQNRVKEILTQDLLTKRATVDSLGAKRRALIQEMAPYQARLKVLKDNSFELGRLRKEFDTARDTYLLYQQKGEEARISQAMDKEKIINVGIIQEAFPPVLPLGRGLIMALALAAISGLVLGVGSVFALEFLNVTIKHEDDVERFLEVPVLATIRQF